MDKLKIGLVVDSMQLPAWQVRVVESIGESGAGVLSVIIKKEQSKAKSIPLLYSLYKKYDDRRPITWPDAMSLKDISEVVAGVEIVNTTAAKGKDIDIVLNFSEGALSAEVAALPRLGVCSYFFGDTESTAAAGIWEVLTRNPLLVCGLKLSTKDGAEQILYQSYSLANPVSVKITMQRCYWKSASFLARVLKNLRKGQNTVSIIKAGTKRERTIPSNISFGYLFAQANFKRIVNKLKRLSVRKDWVLLYDSNSYEGKKFSFADSKILAAPKGFFWADPIVMEKDGKHFVFLEEYVYAEHKGRISVIAFDKNGNCSEAIPILETPYHLSYPFVFEYEGGYYMIPESSANKTIDLYKCIEFPYKWEFHKTLMAGVTAVDTTVLQHEGKCWLFTNIEENRGATAVDELSLFYTDHLINSKLKSHPLNPIISDARSARPAGPVFERDGFLYRPSQVCIPYYGWATSINKIVKLTEAEYEEIAEELIEPATGKGFSGIHTISYAGNMCVTDALLDMKK